MEIFFYKMLVILVFTMDPQPLTSVPEGPNPNAAAISFLKGDLAIVEKYAVRLFAKNVETNDPQVNGLIQAMTDRIITLRRSIASLENS